MQTLIRRRSRASGRRVILCVRAGAGPAQRPAAHGDSGRREGILRPRWRARPTTVSRIELLHHLRPIRSLSKVELELLPENLGEDGDRIEAFALGEAASVPVALIVHEDGPRRLPDLVTLAGRVDEEANNS